MAARVLFVRNDPTAPEALLGEVFAELGFDADTFDVLPPQRPGDVAVDPVIEVEFPDPSGYDVIVPLGARWSAYDDRLPWIEAEMDLVRRALAAGAGVLGVCFGAQLLARALGGTVTRAPQPELGWHDIDSAEPDLVPAGPWFQWHFDRLTVPPGASEVARSPRAVQAFRLGRALGLQFHPELDADLLELWIAEDRDADMARLGIGAGDLRSQTAAIVDDAARRLRLLVRGYLSLLGEDVQDGPYRFG